MQQSPSTILLLDEPETMRALSLGPEDLSWLVATRQLTPISINGKRRFLLREIDALVRVYQANQPRK